MTSLVFLVEQVAFGLFILIALAVIWHLRKLLLERSEYRATYFELERDLSRYRQVNSFTMIVLLIQFGLIILGIQQVVAPTLRAETELDELIAQNPQDLPFNTPTPQPLTGDLGIDPVPPLRSEDDVQVVVATPTLTPTPVGTIIPNPPAISGCDTENATLQIPANGMRVFNAVPVVGRATVENFAYAKVEIAGPSTLGSFAVIDDKRIPIDEESEFSQFVPAGYDEGWYQFRLAVFDITDTMRAHCMVNIFITEPFPTATPIGATGGES